MKNIFPPVIENLLKEVKSLLDAQPYNSSHDELHKIIPAVEHYKKQLEQDDLISLFIESQGDRSVGINSEQIEIRMWRGYIRPTDNEISYRSNFSVDPTEPFLRKEIKKLFKEAAELLFATNMKNIWFEDECIECGSHLIEATKNFEPVLICSNKNCISNMPDEEIDPETNTGIAGDVAYGF
jgi:hypothetical protein